MVKTMFYFFLNYKRKNKISIIIELKDGNSCFGEIEKLDVFMNILFENIFIAIKNGQKFKKAKKIFLKANTVKYIRFL